MISYNQFSLVISSTFTLSELLSMVKLFHFSPKGTRFNTNLFKKDYYSW